MERPNPDLTPGDSAIDSEDDRPDEAIVIRRPERLTIADWEYEKEGETVTTADENPDYPADEQVVVVAFRDALDAEWPDWRDADPGALAEGVEERGVKEYGFPESRLGPVESGGADPGWLDGLADRLEDAGWDVTHRGTELAVEQFGEEYRIAADGTVEGEGEYRTPLGNLVEAERE